MSSSRLATTVVGVAIFFNGWAVPARAALTCYGNQRQRHPDGDAARRRHHPQRRIDHDPDQLRELVRADPDLAHDLHLELAEELGSFDIVRIVTKLPNAQQTKTRSKP